MAEPTDETKFKVSVLLAEYNTLRAEAVARGGHFYQTIAISAGAVIFLLGAFSTWLMNADKMTLPVQRATWWVLIFAAALALSVTGLLFWLIRRDLEKAVQRVREIEVDINDRAGEDLLIWENLWGGAETGYVGRARPKRRETLKTVTVPIRSRGGTEIRPVSASPSEP